MNKKTDNTSKNSLPKHSSTTYGMSKRTINFLNAMTVVGYVFVGLILVISIYLIIAYSAGLLDDRKEALTGLKFSTTDALVINENGGSTSLQILSSGATPIEGDNGEQSFEDNAIIEEIRLTVRDAPVNGRIIDNIISIPDTVMLDQKFTITAKLDEDGYNVGGTCYIFAETANNELYRVAQPLEVRVDVPVESMEIVATNPNTNEEIDLSTANFIFDDKVQLSVKVYPERAINAYGVQDILKNIRFSSDDTDNAYVDASTGLINVTYNPVFTSNEELVEPYAYSTITATIDKYFANSTQTVSSSCVLRLFPLQLAEIVIENELYSQLDSLIRTQLYSNEPLKLSAQDTGLDDVINLDIFLRPTIYNPDNNADPLGDLLSRFYITYTSSLETERKPALVIEEVPVITSTGVNTSYFEITPQRVIEPNETVYLNIGILDYSEDLIISRQVDIYTTTPTSFNFVDENNNENIITSLSMEITKYDDDATANEYAISTINYVTTGTENASFSKFLFFLDGGSTNLNSANSAIIAVDEYRQVFAEGTTLPYNTIRALGAGTVSIVPYVVRTDENGNAIDVNYNIIQDGQSNGFRLVSDIENAVAGEYIIESSYSPLTVNVVELLVDFTIYKDESLTNEVDTDSGSPLLMGTMLTNQLVLYAKPNSALALPTSNEYTRWALTYGDITFSENNNTNNFEKPNLNGSGTSTGVEFVEVSTPAEVEGGQGTYLRYMSFTLIAPEPVELGRVDINYNFQNNTSFMTSVYLTARDIPVSTISVDTEGTTIVNDRTYAGLKTWEFNTELSNDYITNNNMNYIRINWTDGNGNLIVIPNVTYGASGEYAGFNPSNVQRYVEYYIFDTTATYEVNGESMNVKQIFSQAYSLNTTDPLYNTYWDFIQENLLVQNNKADDSTNMENCYIQTITVNSGNNEYYQTIQFYKELPQNHEIFMFFRPSVDGVVESISSVKPDMVMLSYEWPTVQWTESTPVAEATQDGGYYILSNDIRQIEFTLNDLLYSNIRVNYPSASSQVANNYSISISREDLTQAGYLEYQLVQDQESGEITNFVFKIVENAPLTTATRYTVTITKSVGIAYSSRWTDEIWQQAVQDLTSIENYNNYLLNTTQTFTTTQTLNFVILANS